MSRWTHISGCLYVDTHTEDKDIENIVKKLLKKAPEITGSERNADVFVNVLSGHNSWTNCDCEHCEYMNTIVHLEEGGFQCKAPRDYECPEGKYQTCVAITLIGDFRDRDGDITRNEVEAFIRYIQEFGFDIDYSTVVVRDDWDRGDFYMQIKYNEDDWTDKGEIIWKKF